MASTREGRRSRRNNPGEAQGSLLEPAHTAVDAATRHHHEPSAGFRGPQVCKLVGITYRQLDYWARTGLLCPSVTAAHGSGTKRGYSYTDLLQLKVVKQLLDAGVSLRSARRAIDCLRASFGEEMASANLVINGSSSVLARTKGELVDLLAGGQGVFNIIPLSGVVEELDADIVRIGGASTAPGDVPGADKPKSAKAVKAARATRAARAAAGAAAGG